MNPLRVKGGGMGGPYPCGASSRLYFAPREGVPHPRCSVTSKVLRALGAVGTIPRWFTIPLCWPKAHGPPPLLGGGRYTREKASPGGRIVSLGCSLVILPGWPP